MSYLSYVNKLFSNVKGFYQEINAATLTGAIDTLIIEQDDGTFKSSPFHVRFGKLGVLRSREKVVDIEINGEPVDIQMKLGESGEAFFVEAHDEEEDLPEYLATSPLQYDPDLMEQGLHMLKEQVRANEDQGHSDDLGANDLRTHDLEHDNKDEAEATVGTHVTHIGLGPKDPDSVHLDAIHESIESQSPKSSHHSSHDADVDIRIENEDGELIKLKKKRRRRRKTKPKLHDSASNSQTVTLNEEPSTNDLFHSTTDIFDLDMEDLSTDEELSKLTSTMSKTAITKSVSLPTVEENKFNRTSDWAKTHEGFGYLNNHPFSDTDLSPLGSPSTSRPHTPKSDTEVDRQQKSEFNDRLIDEPEDDTLWEWGAMPRKSIADTDTSLLTRQNSLADEKGKGTGGLFNFMRKTKNVRHKPEAEGIYLDDLDLDEMDEETAKLYFPKRFSNTFFQSIEKDEDVESGRGASLPQSPNSVEGAIGGPANTTILASDIKSLGNYSISLCGGLMEPEGITLHKFMSKIVTYDDLCKEPAMMNNPDLVVRIATQYYNWQTAAPMILSQIVFQKPLPEMTVQGLVRTHMPKKKEKKGGYSWFSWRRTSPQAKGSPVGPSAPGAPIDSINIPPHPNPMILESKEGEPSVHEMMPSLENTNLMNEDKTMDRLVVSADHSSSEGDTEGSDRTGLIMKRKRKVYRKTLRLTSEQIVQLNLQPGQNEVTYSVTTQFQGTKRCTSNIYLWKYNDKIIVSDIDGTITKSDVLGQILPVVGRDWSQSGVAQLYSRIAGNGYKFLYLSARAIGQSKLTKDLLQNIKQGEMTLPAGPLFLSPTSLINAFHKEVIEKKPEEFKISCLTDVGSLFSPGSNPFYAGFGNKVNDVYAYKAINIPTFRIFTINHHGELRHELSLTFQTSYTKLTDVADHFFPPLHNRVLRCTRACEYNPVHYWRDPLPEVSPVELDNVVAGGTSNDVQEPAPVPPSTQS